MTKLTGFIAPGSDKAYFFADKEYVQYDVAADAVDAGYPKAIAGDWSGVFEADIDAVLPWPDGSLYFFRGNEYLKCEPGSTSAAVGYPRSIAEGWPGVFECDIDAAVLWAGGQTAYFFSGAQYVKYDVTADAAVEGYPKPIAGNWPGLFESGIDAALLWPSGSAYFFRGDQYTKYDVGEDAAVHGYPLSITENWSGLPIDPESRGGFPSSVDGRQGPPAVEKPGGGRITDKTEPSQSDRVTVPGHGGSHVVLHRLAGEQWAQLVEAARADGIPEPMLLPVSGYRSVASQQSIWEAALSKYGSETEARKWVAKPGGSSHHSGRAVDCWLGGGTNSENVAGQRQTVAWKWLVDNAERFGFYPYQVEPWHWEYNPPAR